MPYIKPEQRQFATVTLKDVGELNYTISVLCHNYISKRGGGTRYQYINDVIGALECAKLELYRTVAADYEDIKRKENGSVSTLDEVKNA